MCHLLYWCQEMISLKMFLIMFYLQIWTHEKGCLFVILLFLISYIKNQSKLTYETKKKSEFRNYYLTCEHPILQGPSSEADNRSARQDIHPILWNTVINYLVHKHLPLEPNLKQMNLISILPSTVSSPNWCLPFRCFDYISVTIFDISHACYKSLPIILLD